MSGLIVRYDRDIAAHDDNPSRLAGEEYGVADEADAAKYHPFAKIVGTQDGTAMDVDEGVSAAGFPDWYVRRTEKAVEDGRELLAV
jgi:ABC-type amino acid transport substrate-binding protein